MTEPVRQQLSNSLVLVVEDEEPVAELITEILERYGLDVLAARNDVEAIGHLRANQPYACVVLDVNLRQGLTGFDVARIARDVTPDLPILFVSGQTDQASFQAHAVPGATFLSKPFTPDELVASIGALVGKDAAR